METLLGLLVFLLLLSAVLRLCKAIVAGNGRLPLPPGPPTFPFVGNLFVIPRTAPWAGYRDMSKKYGMYFSKLQDPRCPNLRQLHFHREPHMSPRTGADSGRHRGRSDRHGSARETVGELRGQTRAQGCPTVRAAT